MNSALVVHGLLVLMESLYCLLLCRYTYLLDKLVTHGMHTLFVGPTGTGKTVYIKRHLQVPGLGA